MTANPCTPEFKSAMETAVRMLTRRNHTCHELRVKLTRKGVTRSVADEVVEACRRLGYLDDGRMAGFYVDELRAKGYGTRFVQKAMRAKGFDGPLIESALARLEHDDELASARRALEKKRKTFEREKDPRKRREKIYRYLYSRGFSSSVISALTHR